MKTTRTRRILLWIGAVLALLIITLVLLLAFFDWNRAKPWINQKVSESTGRPFAIRGDLSLHWQRGEEEGWHRLIPWPRLTAQDVVLGNPSWATPGANMAEVKSVTFSLNPWPLLEKKITVPSLRVDHLKLALERDAENRNNWTFKSDGESKWTFDLKELALNHAELKLDDAVKNIHFSGLLDTLAQTTPEGYGIGWSAKGKYNRANIDASGKAGGILSLRDKAAPFPLQADVKVGATRIALKGTMTDPANLSALDLQLKIAGASMAQLYALTGIVLPDTPPFMTEGRLTGSPNKQGGNWTYEKFPGRVGDSDLSGTLAYEGKEPRSLLKGAVESKLLQFSDLGPLIGADSAKKGEADKTSDKTASKQPVNKALPIEPFRTDRWKKFDADVTFAGKRIVRNPALPIDNLSTHLKMQAGVLTLEPLKFGVAGGTLDSHIKLDGSSDVLKAQLKTAARHLKLQQLFPTVQKMQASFGELNGDIALTSTGNSVAALLGASNGDMKLLINEGAISKLLLEEIGLNVGNIVLNKLFGDKQVTLNCLASDFDIKSGVIKTNVFLMDTSEALLTVDGQVDLAKETMDLTIKPDTKGLRIISLRTPITVRGTFKDPKVGVDKGVLALKAGGALALGALAPIAALIPLINPGDNRDNHACGNLLSQVKDKPLSAQPDKSAQR